MSGGRVENHWRLRGGDGYLISVFFFVLFCFFVCFFFVLFFFVLVYWLRSTTNLRF